VNILKQVDSDAEDEALRKQEELIRLIPEIKVNEATKILIALRP
jgi:hypothetical protein